MPETDLKKRVVAGLTDENREIFERLEKASQDGGDIYLTAEEAASLKRLVFHVMSMNLRIEEWIARA